MPDRRPPLSLRFGRTLHRLKARGPTEVFGLGVTRLKEAWRSADELILCVRPAEPMERPGDGMLLREAAPDDGPRYSRDIGTDTDKSFRGRLAPDVMCFVVEGEGRFLHASWVTTTGAWTREIGAFLAPPVGDAYVYESFTRADARGRGIYPFALAGIVTTMAQRGTQSIWVGVEAANTPSRKAIAKAGFEEAFTLRFGRRLGKVTTKEATGPRAERARHFVRRRL
ncbi:MAG: GNAT family N-acetyltransferase [Actinomycetota bacterium]